MNSKEQIEFERPFQNNEESSINEEFTATAAPATNAQSPHDGNGNSKMPLNFRSQRRGSVSAESYQPLRRSSTAINSSLTGAHSAAENVQLMKVSQNILSAVKNNFLFRSLDPEQLALVFAALKERPVQPGEIIIKQGDEGDNFYIVEEGLYAVEVDGREVVKIGPTGSFGELALMYNAPRAATVRALQKGLLYAVDRVTFRRVIIDLAHEKRCKYMDFLKSLPLLNLTLSELEISKIADALEEVTFSVVGEAIILQGDLGDAFYIVAQGVASVIKDNIHVATLNPGDYFGELALLNKQPRAASVLVKEAPLKCLRLGEADFVRLLGPLKDLLKKRNEDQYNQYKKYIDE